MPSNLRRTCALAGLTAALTLAAIASPVQAWGHQGHILITRLAALRIINDPASPPGLIAFLKHNMKYDMAACKKLATVETVGAHAENYTAGLDGACTLPDRIQATAAGKKTIIQPFGMTESHMHFMDMEWLGKNPSYAPDLSHRPKIADIPHDYKDPRWKMAGFVPFRVEEYYNKTVLAFGPGDKPADNAEALRCLGYLCHYIEDSTQPMHATIDYRAYSYLFAAHIPGITEVKTPLKDGGESITYRVKDFEDVNPHGDLEFQLFENANEPRKTWRLEFWNELIARIDADAKIAVAHKNDPNIAKAGSFVRDLQILTDSYDYLPAIGKAAAAAYATGKFNAPAFFLSEDTVHGQKMNIIQLIAERNAVGVLEVERTIRAAWAASKNPADVAASKKFLKNFYASAVAPTTIPAMMPATAPATAPATTKKAAAQPTNDGFGGPPVPTSEVEAGTRQ